MIPLKPNKTLIPTSFNLDNTPSPVKNDFDVAMDIPTGMVFLTLNDDVTRMFTIPYPIAYQLGLRLVESSAILNFAKSVDLQIEQEIDMNPTENQTNE